MPTTYELSPRARKVFDKAEKEGKLSKLFGPEGAEIIGLMKEFLKEKETPEQDYEEEKIRAIEKIDQYWREQTQSLQTENYNLSEQVKELIELQQKSLQETECSELSRELSLKLIEAILEENKDWTEDEKIGPHGYYFSIHSMNIDIIEQFWYSEKFVSKHPELEKYLQTQIKAEFNNMSAESDTFGKWLRGGEEWIKYDGFCQQVTNNLVKVYRERITEYYACERCGKVVSEKHGYHHESSLHRIGKPQNVVKTDTDFTDFDKSIYLFNILCKKCHQKRTDTITKPEDDV